MNRAFLPFSARPHPPGAILPIGLLFLAVLSHRLSLQTPQPLNLSARHPYPVENVLGLSPRKSYFHSLNYCSEYVVLGAWSAVGVFGFLFLKEAVIGIAK
jgi:hypothetical protein